MTKPKVLGKKPPLQFGEYEELNRTEFYRQALLEAADEMDKAMDWDIADLRMMSKKLRVSAGEKKG